MTEPSYKVYIVGDGNTELVEKMFEERGWEITLGFESADLIQFVGGPDIHSQLYHEHCHKKTQPNYLRDLRETRYFLTGRRLDIPMAGICRGGQFLNVMCGGSLWQDVDNHDLKGYHKAWKTNGKAIDVTSTHHQCMIPGPNGKIVLASNESTKKVKMIGPWEEKYDEEENEEVDIEGIIYEWEDVLCYQPHPEYCDRAEDCQQYYFDCLDKIL